MLTAFSVLAFSQQYPDPQSTLVNDFADIIDPNVSTSISESLREAKESRGLEMTVVTITSRADYGFDSDIETFATGLFNHWSIGNAERNDGILLLVALDDRDMRIELGSGYHPSFNFISEQIIENTFIPHFKTGNYSMGIELGVEEVLRRINSNKLTDKKTPLRRVERLNGGESNEQGSGKPFGGIIYWLLGIVAAIASALGGLKLNRHRTRRCERCGKNMKCLSESDDDAHLSHGQRVEESIRSKDYDVWYCNRDGHTQTHGYRKWFSGHSACRSCSFHTLHSQRTVLNSATTHSEGRALVEYNCKHCHDQWSEHVTIPQKSSSSSTSSRSSGSSFSGGSSSGGGASGSW